VIRIVRGELISVIPALAVPFANANLEEAKRAAS
jgi:hypothetical protein